MITISIAIQLLSFIVLVFIYMIMFSIYCLLRQRNNRIAKMNAGLPYLTKNTNS